MIGQSSVYGHQSL